MHASSLHYFPVALPFVLLFAILLVAVAGLVAVRLIGYAASGMGIRPTSLLLALAASLVGSYVNIPIAYMPERTTAAVAEVTYFGVRYVVPVLREMPATVLAINVGGAVIPIALSLYLVFKNRMAGLSLVAVALVATVCYLLARPVPGIGIALPIFVPPVVTTVFAVALSRRLAAPLAYVSGSLGPLIGADLLNLGKIQGLGAPVASIGGAGTFDGIFVTGLVAVIYASILAPRTAKPGSRVRSEAW